MLGTQDGVMSTHGSSRPIEMNGIPRMAGVKAFSGAAAAVLLMACAGPTPALADTIEAALVRAYQNNPQLNAQPASVRSNDENAPPASNIPTRRRTPPASSSSCAVQTRHAASARR